MLQNKCNNFQQVKNGGAVSMQQKRNKAALPTDAELLAEFYDEDFEEVLADAVLWKDVTRLEAVELFEIVHALRVARTQRYGEGDPRTIIPLPLAIEALILECANDGVLKGQGRKLPTRRTGRRPDSRATELRKYAAKEAIVEFGRKRKDELDELRAQQAFESKVQPAGVNSVIDRAANDASDWGYQEFGIRYGPGTIVRWLQSRT
jgi:hypothetical protein